MAHPNLLLTPNRLQHTPRPPARRAARLLARAGLAALVPVVFAGCESDSFLDPSVTGRWEVTPTVMPILDRLSAVEDEAGELVESTPVTTADLIPEPDEYRLGAGDTVEVTLRDFFEIGKDEVFVRSVDGRGNIELPRLPAVRATGRTSLTLQIAIEDAIRNARIKDNPVVIVTIQGQRKQSFSVLGAVRDPGSFFIPSPDYRLLEAVTAAGGVDENIAYIYVIRQIPLTDEAAGVLPPPEPVAPRPGPPRVAPPPSTPDQPAGNSEDLLELIDELSKPKSNGDSGSAPPSPGALSDDRLVLSTRQPETPAENAPAIDLPDAQSGGMVPPPPTLPNDAGSRSGWIYRDGQWVRSRSAAASDPASNSADPAARRQLTQRKIRVPVPRLLAGDADVNIVIRPGDVIRVPPNKSGLVYFGGQVARPGVIALPTEGRLTLLRAIDSVGGLASLAIPERTDLMRVVGEGRQATIRVNLRAVAEQTQPDIYLKPDDRINVGTNFFALPLAVLRGGFRASYGFGFILDRNFQGEVFGADRATIRN